MEKTTLIAGVGFQKKNYKATFDWDKVFFRSQITILVSKSCKKNFNGILWKKPSLTRGWDFRKKYCKAAFDSDKFFLVRKLFF